LLTPLAFHHDGQAVYDNVEEAADREAKREHNGNEQ
jgi:hypothetical protein